MTLKPLEKDRPNTLWPVGSRFDLLDAWGRNPIEVKRVEVKTLSTSIVGEDSRGVRYFAHTDRIASEARYDKRKAASEFDDLLGIEAKEVPIFEDLI